MHTPRTYSVDGYLLIDMNYIYTARTIEQFRSLNCKMHSKFIKWKNISLYANISFSV